MTGFFTDLRGNPWQPIRAARHRPAIALMREIIAHP